MKDRYVPVRMDEEMEGALEMAKQTLAVRSRSDVVRQAVHDYLSSNRPLIRKQLAEEFKKIRREFSSVGNNLNQVAFHLNGNHPVTTESVQSTQEDLQKVFAQMIRFYRRIENELTR